MTFLNMTMNWVILRSTLPTWESNIGVQHWCPIGKIIIIKLVGDYLKIKKITIGDTAVVF